MKRKKIAKVLRLLCIIIFLLALIFIAIIKNYEPTIVYEYSIENIAIVGASPPTLIAKTITVTYKTYSDEDLELLAHAINAEQGTEYEDEQKTNALQIYTGQVILNRLNSHYMGAESIEDVLYAEGQYACVYDSSWDKPITERAYKNAEILLSGADYSEIYGIEKMPENVIYQAQFEQGSDVWKHIGNTYFCYE